MRPFLAWSALLASVSNAFSRRPTFELLTTIAAAWILCPVRRTVTAILATADPLHVQAHDRFHRFFRESVWESDRLWRPLIARTIDLCPPDQPVLLIIDDTLFPRSGRHVADAGFFRDAVRSTLRKVVYALGLNAVVLCVRVQLPFCSGPIALPAALHFFPKGSPLSHVELAAELVQQLVASYPTRPFHVVADGAYASLARITHHATGPHPVAVISRLRHDARLFALPSPPVPGQRGRPRKRGDRLPSPRHLAASALPQDWETITVRQRGRDVVRHVLSKVCLWYDVTRTEPIRLVIVRDPSGRQHDDFFFSSLSALHPAQIIEHYYDRWSIEVAFRDIKQFLAPQQLQSWAKLGPTTALELGLWLHTAVWLWYSQVASELPAALKRPWYAHKRSVSFADALTALRTTLWHQRIFELLAATPNDPDIIAGYLVPALARTG